MIWDPAKYDNISVMRVLYAQIWNPGNFFIKFISLALFMENYFHLKKTLFFIMLLIQTAGINGNNRVIFLNFTTTFILTFNLREIKLSSKIS